MPSRSTSARNFSTRVFLIAVTSTLIMGTVPLWVRAVSANAVTIGLVRLIITVAILSTLVGLARGLRQVKTQREWLHLAAIGVFFGSHWFTYFLSIKYSSASLGAISISTFGIHLLILNWIFKGQRVTVFDFFTVLICFCGCLLVVPSFHIESKATVGMLLGVLSAFFYACLPLLHQNIQHISTLTRSWGQSTFAFIVFLPMVGWSEWQLSVNDWIMLGILGVFCTFIAHSMWVKSSTELPAIITSLVYYLYLPVAIFLSVVFLNEELSLKMILGAAMILSANIIQSFIAWRNNRQAQDIQPE